MAAPVDYVNDARVIAQIDNFMSINNCNRSGPDRSGRLLNRLGTDYISGAGGQLDFMLGAYLSKGGKKLPLHAPLPFKGA